MWGIFFNCTDLIPDLVDLEAYVPLSWMKMSHQFHSWGWGLMPGGTAAQGKDVAQGK